MRLKDKVAIVTGAAQGLGKVFSISLAREGASIMATDVLPLETTVKEVQSIGAAARGIQADVSNETDTVKVAEETFRAFGRVDILITCAAVYYGLARKPFFEIDPREFDRVMAVNVKGAWLCIKAVFPYMKRQGKGKIVNLSSETFFTGSQGFVHYVASKGAIVGLTRSLAGELGPYHININAIAPGFTDTEASRKLADVTQYDVSRTPLGRLEQPQDIVGTVIFLVSEDSDFMTGQTLLVDGGRAMH